jgi:uncharacterized membrane protein
METKKTALGLEENIEGLLTYVLGWVSAIVFLVLEPENRFVRFHAMQSLVTFGAITIILIVLWLWLMYKAYLGEMYKLPTIGDFAEAQVK